MVTKFLKQLLFKKSLYTLGIVILSIVFFRYTENAKLVNFIPSVLKVMKPFIIGAVLALCFKLWHKLSWKKYFKQTGIF